MNRREWIAGASAGAAGLLLPTGCAEAGQADPPPSVPQPRRPGSVVTPPASPDALTPEQFGARGDGVTDDSAAFAALAARVNERGGGEVAFRRTTYRVGRQGGYERRTRYAFEPAPLLEFAGCTRPLTIRGNGAIIRCAPGLRYGTFHRNNGEPFFHDMPHRGWDQLATPYRWMVKVEGCTGPVEISDLELDGNLAAHLLGGGHGDTGHQIPATGIGLYDNRGGEVLRRIHTHHHALDGLLIDGPDWDGSGGPERLIEDVRSEFNGRQGCSVTGGGGYAFRRCIFSHTGRAGISSAPGAGVDIEAEAGKRVGGLLFRDCLFADNVGQGMVADSGPSKGARFVGCTFVGTTNWSVWPNKPNIAFQGCTFVGPVVRCFGDSERPELATRFERCSFRDDPRLSPTGQVYGGENPDRPIADLPDNPGVRFEGCDFRLTDRAVLPWTTNAVTFADCTMSQRSRARSYPRGTFLGRNRIDGNAVLTGAVVRGELLLNGRLVARGRVT
ncbi:right-handed parallel beta-helix repeat-containing protein [Sphingosinicella terrae]|uniref:right-handed parallel beta-helix repeat-containing protein n=1 Tax=Sphingosinicella terrae TaxID=2172047 RepID=UPI0013B36E7F|nr:right-handed parallel beta-helix repeat-containing protein [Sphingosinicella terrae]